MLDNLNNQMTDTISARKASREQKELERNRRIAEVALSAFPPKPESATLYFTGWGYEKPVALHEWGWSYTFGRWGRTVTFASGWHGYTWPAIDSALSTARQLTEGGAK